jgi:hypothetical protein
MQSITKACWLLLKGICEQLEMGNFESNETNLAATGKYLQFGIEETISKYPYSASTYPFRKTELLKISILKNRTSKYPFSKEPHLEY